MSETLEASNRYKRWLYVCQGESLNSYNFLKSPKCPALSKLQTQRLLNITIGKITVKRKAERKTEETTSEVSNHDNWPSFALFRFLHADTASQHSNVSDRCYPAVPNEGWRKVEVLPHANCARFHPPLLSPIFLASRGGNGKPSKYLGASIYPRVSGGKREDSANIEGRGEIEERWARGERKGEEKFFPKTVPSPVRFRKATAGGAGRRLKDGAEENRPAYRDY